ncbi:hypothetical protein NKH77_18465 [Streptomyces sp. M19]
MGGDILTGATTLTQSVLRPVPRVDRTAPRCPGVPVLGGDPPGPGCTACRATSRRVRRCAGSTGGRSAVAGPGG